MTTVDDAIRDAYKARDKRIHAIRDAAAALGRGTPTTEVALLANLVAELAQLTIEVQ